jgi:hypothetical protein
LIMAKGKTQGKTDTINLTVVVHGLFSFVIHQGFLDLVTPVLEEHVVAAGTWGSEMLLQSGERYILSGPQNTPVRGVKIDPNHIQLSATDSGITSIDPSHERFCCIRMPVPAEINVLRYMTLDQPHPPIFVGKAVNENSLNVEQVPTITSLRFPVPISNVGDVLFGEMWKWTGSPDEHLQIWAEPAFLTHDDHMSMAFNTLVGMFAGLDLDVNPEVDQFEWTPGFPPGVEGKQGIDPNDLMTLQERCGVASGVAKHPHLAVVHVRNCFSTVVMG